MGDIIFFCHHLLEPQFLACETANLHFISDNKINLLAPREITKFKLQSDSFFELYFAWQSAILELSIVDFYYVDKTRLIE